MSANNIVAIIDDDEIRDFLGYDRTKTIDFNYIFQSGYTPLTLAVRKSDLANITKIVRKGADVNQREKGGATPLLLAIYLNRFDVVKFLVDNGASINMEDSYDTPLTLAVRKENLKIIKYLVDKRAKKDAVNVEGISPIFWAIRNEKLRILQILVNAGCPERLKNAFGDTPLIAAIKNGSSKKIIQCLLQNGAQINQTTLLWLAEKGDLVTIRILIENGADANLVGADGNTPLAIAVRYKHETLVEYLVGLGVNMCKFGPNGKTPLLWAVLNQDAKMVKYLLDHGCTYIANSVFLDAIGTKNLFIVQMLHQRGADKKRVSQMTPLAKALEVSSVDIAKYLLDNGANFSDDLHNESTYLIKFINEKNFKMVKLLTERGVKLEKLSSCGHTPLTKSIELEEFEMVRYLVENKANVNQPNKFGYTPLAMATKVNDFRTFQYLVEAGANIDDDPNKADEKLSHYYQIAKEQIAHREQVFKEYASNQEDADEPTVEPIADEEVSLIETEGDVPKTDFFLGPVSVRRFGKSEVVFWGRRFCQLMLNYVFVVLRNAFIEMLLLGRRYYHLSGLKIEVERAFSPPERTRFCFRTVTVFVVLIVFFIFI